MGWGGDCLYDWVFLVKLNVYINTELQIKDRYTFKKICLKFIFFKNPANEPSKRRSNERQVHRVYEDTSNRLSLYNLVRARGFRGDKVFADRISISWKSSIQVYRSINTHQNNFGVFSKSYWSINNHH